MIRVTIHNELLVRLDEVPVHLREVIQSKFSVLMGELYRKAIRQLSNGKYEATDEVEYGVEHQGQLMIGYFEPKTVKAQVQESGGTRWYEIIPTKANVLRFLGKSGEIVYTKRVFHPPAAGKHYLRDTIARELSYLSEELREALET